MALILKNPHSILAAMRSRPQDVLEIELPSKDARGSSAAQSDWMAIKNLAQKNHITVTKGSIENQGQRSSGRRSRNYSGPDAARSGSGSCLIRPRNDVSVEEMIRNSKLPREDGHASEFGLYLALDCVQDPQNLGAIFRIAAFFGVRGLLLTEDRSASMTPVVYDVASGGVEDVPFSFQTNMSRSLAKLKEAGFWIMGTSEHAEESYIEHELDRNWVLVLGNEEKGMRSLVSQNCDVLVGVPPSGEVVTSLNVAMTSAVILSHLAQQK